MKKTNFEKLKELKEYEAAYILSFMPVYVMTVQTEIGADNLDVFDQNEGSIEIITAWLKEEYNEEKGFKMYLFGETKYLTSDDMKEYSYLEDSDNDYSSYFEDDEEED